MFGHESELLLLKPSSTRWLRGVFAAADKDGSMTLEREEYRELLKPLRQNGGSESRSSNIQDISEGNMYYLYPFIHTVYIYIYVYMYIYMLHMYVYV